MAEGYSLWEQHNWSSYNGRFWTKKTGDLTWRMRPNLQLNKLDDNDDVYIEFEVLYDHHLSNLWELQTETKLTLFNSFFSTAPRPTIEIIKNCYFDKCQLHMRSPIRFYFGKFGSIRTLIALKTGELNGITIDMLIRVVKKSTVGMQIPPAECFHRTINIISEVVLTFIRSEPFPGEQKSYEFYVDKLALTPVSSVFRDILSEETNNNNENVINDIFSFKNFKKYTISLDIWICFLRLLYRRKQEFTKDIIDGILYLAARYNVQFLITDCEEFLISTDEISNFRKLHLAERCDLAKLQLAALERITIDILQKDKQYVFKVFDQMSPKSLKAILVKFCEEEI